MSIALMLDPQGDAGRSCARRRDMRATLDRLDSDHPRRAGTRRLLQTAFTLPRVSNAGGNQQPGPFKHWERRARSRGLHRRLLPRVRDHSLHDDRAKGRAAVQRGEEARRLLGRQHRARAEEGVVRRPSGDGAGAGALRPLRQRQRRRAARATSTSSSASSCSTIAITPRATSANAPSTTRATCRSSSSTRPWATRCAPSTTTPAWRTSRWRRTTPTTRARSSRSGTTSSTRSTTSPAASAAARRRKGFGPNYSLRNDAYCESCSSCGEIFFQWKLDLTYHDAKYADLYEETLYNALLGGLAMDGKTSTTPTRSMRDECGRRGTPSRAASATFRARCS